MEQQTVFRLSSAEVIFRIGPAHVTTVTKGQVNLSVLADCKAETPLIGFVVDLLYNKLCTCRGYCGFVVDLLCMMWTCYGFIVDLLWVCSMLYMT